MKKLNETTTKFPQTEIWNDSCSCKELSYAIENGAIGATTNPVIVGNVLKQELSEWENEIKAVISENPNMIEDDIAWEMIKRMGKKASLLLLDLYKESKGLKGRISFQTNAKYYHNTSLMVEHARELAAVCENSQIKAPASKEGIAAYEEMTYAGISINATVSFTVAQAIQTAEAVERGLRRREAEGLDTSTMHPVCTLMAGRLDDHLKNYVDAHNMLIEPECLEWGGVAVVKEALRLYKQRGYRTKILVAAFRNQHHWESLIGEDVVLTIPYGWQKKFNDSDVEVIDHSDFNVNEKYLEQLHQLDEFNKAYYENGLALEEFDSYGAFVVAIKQFLEGYDGLIKLIRSYFVIKERRKN